LKFPEKTYEYLETGKRIDEHKSTFESRLQTTPGHWYLAITDLTYKMEPQDVETVLNMKITSDKWNHPVL